MYTIIGPQEVGALGQIVHFVVLDFVVVGLGLLQTAMDKIMNV
jgi:hypothetical protein